MERERRRRFKRCATAFLALGYIALNGHLSHAATPPPVGYLHDNSISSDLYYSVPPPPKNDSMIGQLDLVMVRMAKTGDYAAEVEAFNDAAAYSFDQLMGRFSPAAGTTLSPTATPVIAHILARVMVDTSDYATLAKNTPGNDRERPYVKHSDISPCETDFLRKTDDQSYPSGHSTNGYAAALVLSKIIPDRGDVLLAGGVQYGNNRVVCGVHYPTDVEEGRYLAIAIVAQLEKSREFREDLECAQEAYLNSGAGLPKSPPVTAACLALSVKYETEFNPPSTH